MKRKLNMLLLIPALIFVLGSCIENDPILFTDSVAEFDATVWNAPAVGRTYPILTRVAGYGRAVSTTLDPLITRTSGTVNFRINLVSGQFSADETLNISVVSSVTTAIAGTHYSIPTSVIVPANSSFALVPVTIINNGPGTGSVDLVLQIDGSTKVKPSENFKNLGIRIPLN